MTNKSKKEFNNKGVNIDKTANIEAESDISYSDQFSKIANILIDHNWVIDIDSVDKNILYFVKDDERYMLYLFNFNGTNIEWIADEDRVGIDPPLWWSESSHCVSPIYSVKEYTVSKYSESGNYYYPIVIMLDTNYISNVEDSIHDWDDITVVSTDRFCRYIASEDNLRLLATDIDDVGLAHNDKSSSKLPITKPTDCDDIDTDSEEFEEIEFERVRFGVDMESNLILMASPSLATHFRASDDILLLVWLDIKGTIMRGAKYSFELYDSKNNLITNYITTIRDVNNTLVSLSPEVALAGEYWFYIRHNGKELYCQKLTFVDIENGYNTYFNLDAFGLYRIEPEDKSGNFVPILDRGAMSCFDCNNFAGVLVTPQFKNISDIEIPYQFITTIKNSDGKVVYEREDSGKFDIGEMYISISEVRGEVVSNGSYTIEIKFLDETILTTDFVVGQRNVRATYNVSMLTSNSHLKGVKKQKVADPMAEMEAMIGLESIKKDIRKLVAKIELDKLRKTQGLPTKPQQLHMAFLGNPGTGKTTVAKLLGQIYKEIGVLSKGQVVFEDRSSLMTSNWGGEGEMVNKAIENAQGGILFIDEAYDLITEHKSDPGKLIISALLQAMADEKHRDFMVIFAGYTMPMERLLSKNPGLRSRLTSIYFDDYKVPEMMQIADLWLGKNCYNFTPEARNHFESILASAYALRNENFGNARYVVNLLENEIQPALAERVMQHNNLTATLPLLTTIEACDMPNYNFNRDSADRAIAQLDNMIGLGELKKQIRSHLSLIRFAQSRRNNNIDTPIPPLHMVFTGNPGTGKSSVAEYLGDIYRSMGILSVGNVIKVTRADMIDSAIGGTEEKMKELLNAAHGNILFIDEAYTLFSKGDRDYGKNAVEVLLDALGKENTDMIVILAGYPKEMEELLTINPGIKGRFPYTFNFEDYDETELFEIAEGVIERNSLSLTKGAAEALKAVIRKECKVKDSNFSNARFVVRLITTQIIPNMAMRLDGETDPDKLKRILQRDIPIEYKQIRMINENLFDEEMIETALEQLDGMVGLTKVKNAIHQFVDFARSMNRKDPTQIERYPLKWNFVGNTGTGKSSVAEILSQILKAMHLLGRGHTVEVKAEELYGVATYKADELIQQRMRESLQGLLFVDGDAPQFRAENSSFNPEYLRICLAVNTNEIHGRFAVVIAEQDSQSVGLARSLNKIGISNFNHTLIFDDYTADELMTILMMQLAKHKLQLKTDAVTIMYEYIERLCNDFNITDANARTMKELARTIRNMAAANGERCIITSDIVANFATLEPPRKKIGY